MVEIRTLELKIYTLAELICRDQQLKFLYPNIPKESLCSSYSKFSIIILVGNYNPYPLMMGKLLIFIDNNQHIIKLSDNFHYI